MGNAKILLASSAVAALLCSAAQAQTLVYCSEGSPEGFDPAPYTAGTTFDASSKPIYNRLVEFKRGTSEVRPGLAESWDISDDGREYTFHLREGVPFHTTEYFTPTRDFMADDVLFSFNRQRLTDDPFYEYTPGISWEYFNSMSMPELIEDIVKVDDYTVKFVLTRPEAPFIANMAMDFASILSKEYADALAEEGRKEQLNQQPVGTGPFQFVGYQQDAAIRYRRFEDHWAGAQPIENLVFAITIDPAVRRQKLEAGECHVMPYPAPADIEALQNASGIKVMEQQGLNVGYLAYNTQQAPFDDVRVRKALNMAINKQAILDAVYQGAGVAAKNPIPPTMWSYNDAIEDDPYDPDAARKLLEEAGVENLDMRLWAMPVSRPYNPNARRMAEVIQADFADIGVDVDIVSYEWGEYLDRSKEIDRDGAVLLGWTGDNGDPDNFLAVLLGCDGVGAANRAQWCNEEFNTLIQEAKVLPDQEARAELYEKAQVVFKEQAPWATIAHSVVFMPMRDTVSGYIMDPLGGHWFDGVSLEQ